MNEEFGAKGSYNDFRRTKIIVQNEQEKLKKEQEDEEIKELEKEVKIKQAKTLAAIAPIIISGNVLKTFFGNNRIEKKSIALPNSSEENHKKTSFITTDTHNNIIEVTINNKVIKEKVKVIPKNIEKLLNNKKVEVLEITQEEIPIKKTKIDDELDKIKNKEIISKYEEKLKEARYELKELNYEYQVISENYQKIYNSKELQELLDKLNLIIKKLEQLKEKISLDENIKYDYSYLQELVNNYISTFDEKEIIEEIKDSSLYILISSKIKELEIEKNLLTLELVEKKDKLKLNEDNLEDLKDKYNDYEKFNISLLKLQAEQEAMSKALEQKIANAITEQEKTEIRIRFLNNSSRRITGLIAAQALIPGPRSARNMALLAASYIYLARNTLRPRRVVEKYRVFEVADYSREIENSIAEIDKAIYLIGKTKEEIQRNINDIENTYKEYINQKEIKELLSSLESMYEKLKEKEDEMIRLKEKEQKNLEENKQKNKFVKRYERIS